MATNCTPNWNGRLDHVREYRHTGPQVYAPVTIAVAQYTKTTDQSDFVRYSLPDIYPQKGAFDQYITLPAIPVPANTYFNYRLLFASTTLLATSPDSAYQVTYSLGDFSHTLAVSGLSVRDSTGNSLSFSVTAASGANYSANALLKRQSPHRGSALFWD